MPILMEATLSEPPSSITCFRDVTLYASIFKNKDILVFCEKDHVDLYWYWLKAHGAMDFIEDFVRYKEEPGYIIGENRGNISIPRLDEWTLPMVVGALSRNT